MTAGRRKDVLELVQRHGESDVATLADLLSLHPTTVRFHLDGLVAEGRVERITTTSGSSPGRPRLLYRAAAHEGAPSYRTLATVLAASFGDGPRQKARRARQAGRAWATRLTRPATSESPKSQRAIVESLVTHMDQLGFAPQHSRARGVDSIDMWSCPYIEVARAHPEVTCGVHHGVLEGLLGSRDKDFEIELVPFATADYCRVMLRAIST